MRTISRCLFRAWLPSVLSVLVFGCNAPKVDSGPSYAERVVTYNAELQALDRLEVKRKERIEEYAAATAPNAPADTMERLKGLLESATDVKDRENPDSRTAPIDLNAQLDDLVERQGEAQEIAGQLLDGLLSGASDSNPSEPTPEEAAAFAERKTAFEADLARLDTEIAQQKERVERARLARDAAELENRDSE